VIHLLEYAAIADIRPVIVRQERTGIHMANAMSRRAGRALCLRLRRPCDRAREDYGIADPESLRAEAAAREET
jgi:hypothetical protein